MDNFEFIFFSTNQIENELKTFHPSSGLKTLKRKQMSPSFKQIIEFNRRIFSDKACIKSRNFLFFLLSQILKIIEEILEIHNPIFSRN